MEQFNNKTHIYGRFWIITALVGFIMIPLAISAHFDAFPSASAVFKGLAPIALLFYPTAVIEVVTYTPLLGSGATYLSFVTGNITNLKLPCALSAMDSANVRANSDEGEILSTIAVATSSIVTTIILAFGVLLFSPILPYLTDESSPFAAAFRQVVPALFGALSMSYIAKNYKISIAPIGAVLICLAINGKMSVGVLIIVAVAVALLATHIMFKKGIIK